MKDKIEGKELVVIGVAVQVEEGKMAYDGNDDRREGQKDKRKEIPVHNEWPAKKAEVLYLHGSRTKSQKIQSNRDVDKIADVPPLYQFANHVLAWFLLAGKIPDVYEKYLGNRKQDKVMHEIGN
jgi:hypothetical protein